jgi:glycosyltransferase involved in cell wall biosynthesis
MPSIAIIIPCYNEGGRLDSARFTAFLKLQPSHLFVFVNDGSTDNTASVINAMAKEMPGQIWTLHLEKNKGKASAVSEGILFCLRHPPDGFSLIGYMDADLSTGPDEMARIASIIKDNHLDYGYGSRIKKMNAKIRRSSFRHFVGRVIATIIDSRFQLGIYDTQCGAKLFNTQLAEIITREPFHTKWLFDVEIFLRIHREKPSARGEEIPLLSWMAGGNSKLGIWQAVTIAMEINSLFKNYPQKTDRR